MNSPLVQAVIEIGSTGIRLLVAESALSRKSRKQFTVLDASENRVSIGHDVFTQGSISRESLLACLRILELYREQLVGYGLQPDQVQVIATSAVREAKNRDPFVDRIKVKTGFNVRVIDGIEENRLMYIAVAGCLRTDDLEGFKSGNSIILDISGGATVLMLLEKGRIAGAHSMRLGTVIVGQMLHAIMGSTGDSQRIIGEFVRNARKTLNSEMNLKKVSQFIVLGSDILSVASVCGKKISPLMWQIDRKDFESFAEKIASYSVEECIEKFSMSYQDAGAFQISVIAYSMFLSLTAVDRILVPETSIREGLLLSIDESLRSQIEEDFTQQIAAGAFSLLRKYQGDEEHAEYVKNASLRIYDSMQDELGLDSRDRSLLEVSAILHDVGMFIKPEDHNLHGKYIILNSELFGLNRDERSLVAMIVAYHKGTRKLQDDPEFRLLPRSSRMCVLKLTAILRLADALDRTHKQKLFNFTISFARDSITLRTQGHHNLSLEKLALAQKGVMFENVFGYRIVLV